MQLSEVDLVRDVADLGVTHYLSCSIFVKTRLRAATLTPLASICETRAQARELRAPESSRSRQGFRLCHSGCFLWSYPRGGILSFFHGPAHIGHQPFQLVLGSLQLRRLRSPFSFPGSTPLGVKPRVNQVEMLFLDSTASSRNKARASAEFRHGIRTPFSG
jgi:hypothetical protein